MAARVNRNFVALLVAVLVAVVATGFFAYWKLYHRTPDQLRVEGEKHLVEARRHAAEVDTLTGDAALASYRRSGQEFAQATSLFGQAFTQEPTNVEVLQNYIDSLTQMHAKTAIKAQEYHQELMAKRKLAVELSGNDPARLDAYYQGLMDMAPWAGEGVYQAVFREAENRLAVNPEDATSKKYRGIVGALRLNAGVDLNTQRAVLDDLDTARARLPGDPQLSLALARYQLFEAERVEADPPAFDAAVRAALAAIAEADGVAQEDRSVLLGQAEARLNAVRLLQRVAALRDQQGASADRVASLRTRAETLNDELVGDVARLETSVTETPDIDDLIQTADLLTATDRTPVNDGGEVASTGGLQRTEAMVRRAIQADPLNISYKVMLGNLLRLRQQHDEALTVYREADALEPVGPAEMMLRTDARRRQARFEIASIELIKAEAAVDPDERETLLKGAEAAVAELAKAEQRTARVLLLEGKIALLRGETTKAMQSLDQAVEVYANSGQPNVEAILLSARARQSERQWGAAAERLEGLLAQYPLERSPATERRIRRQLTEIYLAANRMQDAEQQIDRIRTIAPDDPATAALNGQLLLGTGRAEEAERVFREAGLLDNVGVVRQVARAYQREGDADRASGLLGGFLDEDPTNLAVLAELLPRLEAPEREERLAAAEAAGASSEDLLLLRGSDRPEDRQQIVDTLADRGGGTDLEEELRRASLWERLQEPEKAAAAYERARKIDPDSPRLLLEDLRAALEKKDMERAGRLAERASQENLDLAGGRFIRGQVAAAEGDTGRAIVLYTEGLKERPVYDQGWKTLGDLLLREGNNAEASKAYAQATRQRPDNVGALLGLAEAQRAGGREGAALGSLRAAVDVNPENVGIRETYLNYEVARGDTQRAIEYRRSVAERQPADLGNRIALARLLQDRGRPDEAMAELDAAETQPGAGVAVAAARADLSAAAGGPEAGVASMQSWIDGRGDDATSQDFLAQGRLLARLGRVEAATAAFRRAAALEPADDPDRLATRELGDHLFGSGQSAEAAEVYADLLGGDRLSGEDRTRVTLRQAETLLRAGSTEEAERLLAGGETGTESLLLRAMIARGRGDDAAARTRIEEALAADPGSAAAYLQRATLPGADPVAALADAEEASRLDPGNAAARRLRVGLLQALGRAGEAASLLAGRLEADPADVQTRLQLAELRLAEGRESDARSLLAAGRRLTPEDSVWDRFERELNASSSDDARALPAMRASLEENPDANALARLVQRLLRAGDPAAAGEALDAHPAIVQDNPVLQAFRGRALVDAGDRDAGLNVLRAATARARSAGELSAILGEAAAAIGAADAVALSDGAQTPGIDAAVLELIQANTLMAGGDWAAAVALLDRQDSASADAEGAIAERRLRSLATSLQNLGRAEEARRRYEELLKTQPDDVASLNNLAYLLAVDLGSPSEAVPLAERAAEKLPPTAPTVQRASVLDTLGWVQHKSGDQAAARASLEEALRLAPLAPAHLHLAHVYRALDLGTLADDQARQAERAAEESGDTAVLEGVAAYRAAP